MNVLNNLLHGAAHGINPIVHVNTQVTGEEGDRPDIVGYDNGGVERVIIEAKFWAGFTENQPNAYLNRLPDGSSSALLFIAPKARLKTLWPVLRGRVEGTGVQLSAIQEMPGGLRTAQLDGTTRHIMLTSWKTLLSHMSIAAGESLAQRDIEQLRGLTDRMDADAFVPLQSEELSPEFPRRILNFIRLIDGAANQGIEAGWIDPKSVKSGDGRSIRLFGKSAWFAVRFHNWACQKDTPIWIRVNKLGSNKHPDIRSKLNVPDGTASVPIDLPTGVEYDAILDSVVAQLKYIGQTINPDYKISKSE